MQNRTSRIRPPRAVVERVEEYLLSQVGVYDNLILNVTVPPPPRTRGYVEDLDLRVEIIPPSASEKYRLEAKYDPTNSVLYVNLSYFEENYEGRELAEALHRVVAHELVHVYQILYTRSRDDDPRADSPTAGLPGLRERTPQYRQETGELLHHRLDDNEFYPRLEDTINAINFVSRRKPDEIASIVSYVVGESNRPAYRSKHLKEPMAWLKDLGKYAPKKFIKAVRKIKNEFPETAKMRTADFFRQVSPPDELSTLSNGTPTGKGTDLKDKGEGSQMPNGDGARNIGRPSPDSPNLKSRNLDRSESYGRKPAEGFDGGYVHDSGSGSARVIPYDSGFANNSSPLRKGGLIRPPQHLIDQVAEIGKGLLAQYWLRREKEDSSKGGLNAESVEGLEWVLDELDYLPLGVKRGEHDEEEVIFQVNNTQRAFSELEDQLKSANLTYSHFFKLKAKVDQLDAQSIFNDPRGNKALIGSISDGASDLLREFKKWSTGSKQYIPTLMRDDYLEAVERLSKYKVKDGGRYYVEDDELGLVAVHLQESSHGAAQYYWDGIHHIIFNVLKNMTELPLKYLTDRETIAGHELVHAMQQHYANKANIEEAGLPSQKRDKQFRFDMKEKQKELRVQYAREGMDFELISIHALDDIEFYSRLLDEVTNFKRRRVSADRINDEIHKWISKRPFFVSLKRFKRKNWKKAVGIFADAVKPDPRSKKAAPPVDIDKPSGASKKNVPSDEKLWAEIQALAKGESSKPVSRGKESVNPVNDGKGFQTFPSAYANGWALAQYKRLGGKWKKQSSEFKMPRKWDKEHCESKSCDDMGFSEKASCRPYKNCYEKSASRVAHRYLKLSSIPHKFEEVDLKYHTRHEGLDVLFFLNLQMQEDDGTSWGGDELGCIQGAVYEWGRSYNFDSPCDYDIGVLQEKAGDRSTSSIYLAFVSESEIYEDFLGQRLGDHLYLGFIRHIWDELKKPFVFAPHYCVPNGSTNPTARKLWGRLTSKYPSSGKCVLISSRP